MKKREIGKRRTLEKIIKFIDNKKIYDFAVTELKFNLNDYPTIMDLLMAMPDPLILEFYEMARKYEKEVSVYAPGPTYAHQEPGQVRESWIEHERVRRAHGGCDDYSDD